MQIVAPDITFNARCSEQHRVSPNAFRTQDDAGNTWSTCFDCGHAVLLAPDATPPHWLARFCHTGVGVTLVLSLIAYTSWCFAQVLIGGH